MGMTTMLAEAWKGMMRRRRQRLALAELMRMTPRRRDELGIDLVDLDEGNIHHASRKERRLPASPHHLWEGDRLSAFSGKAG